MVSIETHSAFSPEPSVTVFPMTCRRWVLPKPLGPYMKSGL
jgi:hypothetical protein